MKVQADQRQKCRLAIALRAVTLMVGVGTGVMASNAFGRQIVTTTQKRLVLMLGFQTIARKNKQLMTVLVVKQRTWDMDVVESRWIVEGL